MNFTGDEILIVLAAIGVLVLLVWANTLLEAIARFHDWLGKKLEEQQQKQQQKQQRTESEDEPPAEQGRRH